MILKPKPRRLWQEIALAVSVKAILLILIWALWFSDTQNASIDGQQAAAHIFPQQTLKEKNHDADTRTR